MISLKESRFTDILPENLSSELEVQALSYAVSRQISALVDYADRARIYAAIATVPELVLDALAIELRTPVYDESFSLAVKRQLVQETLNFYRTMGTPAAVNKIIEIIFEEGYITEWFDYGGEAYHFKAHTTNPTVTAQNIEEFRRVLSSVKRLSAWLDEIVLELSTPAMTLHVGHWLHAGDVIGFQKATF